MDIMIAERVVTQGQAKYLDGHIKTRLNRQTKLFMLLWPIMSIKNVNKCYCWIAVMYAFKFEHPSDPRPRLQGLLLRLNWP